MLEAKRFTALEALKEGIVDGLGGVEEAVAFVEEMGLVGKGRSGGVYGKLKGVMWGETVGLLEGGIGEGGKDGEEERRGVEMRKRVEEWERGNRVRMAKL